MDNEQTIPRQACRKSRRPQVKKNLMGAMLCALAIIGMNPSWGLPVDVDGDGQVGPLELLDVTLNWHSETLESAEKAAVVGTTFIHLSSPTGSRLILDIDPDSTVTPRGLDLRVDVLSGGITRGLIAVKANMGVDSIRLDGRDGNVIARGIFAGNSTLTSFPVEINGSIGRVRATSFQLGPTGPNITNIADRSVRVPNMDVGPKIYLEGDTGLVKLEAIEFGFGGPQITRNGNRIRVSQLEMVGADLSEHFDINAGESEIQPGTVVSIDPQAPGALRVSSTPYDQTVAGIVSGAGGIQPGVVMGQPGTLADGKHAVALTGRVYCWVDADLGAVEPGNLLTTSATPGHAMRVQDPAQAHGAILGKAMTGLESGRGLVLVLVTLH